MPPFGRAMGMGIGGGGGATGGSAMRQNPGLGPSVGMNMGQRMGRRMGNPNAPPSMMRPPGGIGWGNPNGPGKEGNMGHPPPMGSYPRPDQGGGFMGPMPGRIQGPGGSPWARPQRPQGPAAFGEGTGSNSRTSTDWAQRHPNDPGPMAPRQMPQQNYEQLRQQMQEMGRNPAATPQPMRPDAPDRAYALGQANNNMRSAFQNRMY